MCSNFIVILGTHLAWLQATILKEEHAFPQALQIAVEI